MTARPPAPARTTARPIAALAAACAFAFAAALAAGAGASGAAAPAPKAAAPAPAPAPPAAASAPGPRLKYAPESALAPGRALVLRPEVLAVKEHTLANGLRLLLVEDHSVPSISYYTFYDVGSRLERPGITGISHLFEHMMFNGARKYGPKEFDLFLERAGGSSNAYTTRDDTVYYADFPPAALPVVMDLESDRMGGLDIRPTVLANEQEVVLEERHTRVDDNPEGALDELLWATAFIAHPYSWPILGWEKDIVRTSRDDCMAYYRAHYAPNRATIVAVGDFATADFLRLAERFYARIPAGPARPRTATPEPEQFGERRVDYRRASEIPILLMGYKSPAAADPDTLALDGVQYLLGEGDSARLYRRLVHRDEVANWVYVDFPWHVDPGLFIVGVGVKAGVDPRRVEKIVDEEIADLADHGPNPAELTKVRRLLEMSFLRALETNASRAETIGTYQLLMGDWRVLDDVLETYRTLSAERIRAIASHYLRKDSRTVATLHPLEDGGDK
jgi:zinc protease